MKLTPKTVGDVLEAALGWRVEMTPNGFDLRNDLIVPEHARLQRGSGIAGRGDVWALVCPGGISRAHSVVIKIDTKIKLVRAVLEFMAGPRPPPLSDYTTPRAKRVILPKA